MHESLTPQTRMAEYLRTKLASEDTSDAGTGRSGAEARDSAHSAKANLEVRLLARRRKVEEDQEGAERSLARLLSIPFDQRLRRIAQDTDLRSWPLCSLLLTRCHETVSRHPQAALEQARTALTMARALAEHELSFALGQDLRARAFAALANAQRVIGDFRAAEASFQQAERLFELGSGDVLEQARLFSLKGSLRGDQQRFEESYQLFDAAAAIYRRLGEDRLLSRTLIKKGAQASRTSNRDQAIELLEKGLAGIDANQEPRLAAAAIHCLIYCFSEEGLIAKARTLLEENRELYRHLEASGHRIDLYRLRWLEAGLARQAGEVAEAEACLCGVRAAFIEEGIGSDAALASLELAALFTEQGRTAEIRQLAQEMLPIFQATDLHREAAAALILFQQAAEVEQVTLGLIEKTVAEVRRSRQPSRA